MSSEDKPVKVEEVLVTCSQSPTHLETALISLAHVAFYSDQVELKVNWTLFCSYLNQCG